MEHVILNDPCPPVPINTFTLSVYSLGRSCSAQENNPIPETNNSMQSLFFIKLYVYVFVTNHLS